MSATLLVPAPTMPRSIVIDCETLSTAPNAIITEIAILVFDRAQMRQVDSLTVYPDILSQLASGRTWTKDTIRFHKEQKSLPAKLQGLPPSSACVAVADFFTQYLPERVWIQGTCFDRPLLESFFANYGAPAHLPWPYWKSRDARTLWDLAFPGVKHTPRPHKALEDCQATLTDIAVSLKALNRPEAA